MSKSERVWLVERTYTDRDLVVLVYATPDGRQRLRKELAPTMLRQTTVTAATKADPSNLEPVDDGATVDRYVTEVERVRESHDPEDPI
jgi:hypothetical protein